MNSAPDEALRRIRDGLRLERPPWPQPRGAAARPQAAVLVALTHEARPRVLLGRRARHLLLHAGEVAFAGGKREAGDASPWDTALREAWEEVRLPAHHVDALGELDPLMTRTGFEVHPCVARVPVELDLRVDREEFDSIFMEPLETFADRDLFRVEAMSDGQRTRMVPRYQVGEDDVWGVTAAILALLANVAYDAGLDLQRDWKQTP